VKWVGNIEINPEKIVGFNPGSRETEGNSARRVPFGFPIHRTPTSHPGVPTVVLEPKRDGALA
jgi:hypothetical protein